MDKTLFVMDTIVVVLIVGLAAGYLVWRYVKKAKTGGGCDCENMECPLHGGRRAEDGGQRTEDGRRRAEIHFPPGG